MNKKFFFNIGILTVITIAIIEGLDSCGGDKGSQEDNETSSMNIVEESSQEPETIRILIDNSGSMKGYFNEKNMVPMTQAIKNFRALGKETGTIQFIGDKKPFDDSKSTVASILAQSVFNKDTDMPSLLKEAIQLGGDTVPVIILTDGIVSTSQGQNDIAESEGKIEEVLKSKKSDLGWMIFRGKSNYNGTYYVESERPVKYPKVKLQISQRPFFGIVIGPKDQIRYIEQKTIDNQETWEQNWGCEWIAFNTHDPHLGLKFYAPDNTFFDDKDGVYVLKGGIDSNAKINLMFEYPECLKSYIKKLKPSNATLTLNDNTIKEWKMVQANKGNAEISISAEAVELNTDSDNELSLDFSTKPQNEWIETYSSTNDTMIATDSIEQQKTYQLSSLIAPMTSVSSNTDVKVTFKFKN